MYWKVCHCEKPRRHRAVIMQVDRKTFSEGVLRHLRDLYRRDGV